jgi:thiol-disulfide isomerase/thioredoxin
VNVEEVRMRLKLLVVAATAALAAGAYALEGAGSESRRPFRSFALERFDGDSLSLADLEGKVALVVFWASWCAACQAQLPLLDSLNSAVDHPEFAVIGINEEQNEAAARGYAAAIGLGMPILLGRGEMWQRYQYLGLPYTVLLDREGAIVAEYYGYPGRRRFDTEIAGTPLAELGR